MFCSAGSGVKRVQEDFVGFSRRSLSMVQRNISFRYGWRAFSASLILTCDVRGVRSSAYDSSCTLDGGEGMSDTYRLKSIGDRTPPWELQF